MQLCICCNQVFGFVIFYLKYYTESGIPQRALETNTCAICNNEIMILNNDENLIESTFSLPCGHM